MNIAILGSGPAGLLAAHAAARSKNVVTIFSEGNKSEIFGAQYLHRSIPEITRSEVADFMIQVIKVGTKEGYAKLVYGDPYMSVSWEHFGAGDIPAWDLRAAYEKLWTMYEDRMVPGKLQWTDAMRIASDHDITFSSIPMPALCNRPSSHTFLSIPIWVLVEPPWMDPHDWNADNHMMYYNGFPPDGSEDGVIGFDWYRFSQINGWKAWEFRDAPDPDTSLWKDRYIVAGKKPMSIDCTCPEHLGIIPIGRWGKWQRGELTHHAYEAVERALLKV